MTFADLNFPYKKLLQYVHKFGSAEFASVGLSRHFFVHKPYCRKSYKYEYTIRLLIYIIAYKNATENIKNKENKIKYCIICNINV